LKGPIQAVEVSYLIHATEDAPRIKERVEKALGVHGPREEYELEGHFGNRITRVRCHLLGEEASRVVETLASRLPPGAKRELRDSLEKNVDEHSAFYLRLDKQLLMAGTVGLGTSDSVRLKIKPRLFLLKGGGPEFYREVLRLDG